MVTKVERLEPLSLRKRWMNDLAQAVAFLELLNLAHEIGTDFEACMAPYGRLLNSSETDQGRRGTSGSLGPRTEQFALGSLYYLINYGFEVYGDRYLTEDPKEHGPKVVDLLQNMEFPRLDGDLLIDDIIGKCWHNKYATVAELAKHTETLLTEGTNGEGINNVSITGWRMAMGHVVHGLRSGLGGRWALLRQSTNDETTNQWEPSGDSSGDSCDNADQGHSAEDFSSKKAFCQDLEKRGLLRLLSSGEPEQLGFHF